VPVAFVQRRLHVPRTLAALLVFLISASLLAGMLYAFIRPIVTQSEHFANRFPTYVRDARAGRGPVGHLIKKYKVDDYLERNKAKIQKYLTDLGTGAFNIVKSVAAALAVLVTTFVLAFLMVLYGPNMLEGGLGMLSPPTRARVRAVGSDCSKAITGYVFGNVLISVIAALVTYFSLLGFGVPFRGVLALWVGFADLIPLVGATLGAIPTVAVAFIHSTTAGIGMIIVYVVYQQFENHVIQVVIMSRTVQINQLMVLVSVLIGVELFGFIGALLAIPAAGVIQVVARDIYDHRRGRFKDEPTIGVAEIPMSKAAND
jgi:predicted PurR-regulated permease PerM